LFLLCLFSLCFHPLGQMVAQSLLGLDSGNHTDELSELDKEPRCRLRVISSPRFVTSVKFV
jgi:hypothetical protein